VCDNIKTQTKEDMKMKFKEMMEALIKDNKKSHASLAAMIGRKNPTFISNMVSRGNCNVDTLLEITDALGYEIVIKPKSGENKAERTIRLER
jgi:DNA-binding phage protein